MTMSIITAVRFYSSANLSSSRAAVENNLKFQYNINI